MKYKCRKSTFEEKKHSFNKLIRYYFHLGNPACVYFLDELDDCMTSRQITHYVKFSLMN